jgi:hypothetical protein
MVEGKLLDHPKLEVGQRSRMKVFRVNPKKNIPVKTINDILQKSLELYRSGALKIK